MEPQRIFPKSEQQSIVDLDIEQYANEATYINNTVVKTFAWMDVAVTVQDWQSKEPKKLLSAVNGQFDAGTLRLR